MKILRNALLMMAFGAASLFAGPNTLTDQEKSDGWKLLFNGKDMSSWRNFKSESINEKWKVENGTMMLEGKGGGDIITKDKYEDFELKLDWKISENGNSGIFVRACETGKRVYSKAIEMQILDDERHKDNKLENHRAGSVYDMIATPAGVVKKAGEWNSVYIKVKGKMMAFYLNGTLTGKVNIGSAEWDKLVQNSKFKKWEGFGLNPDGYIGLQDHGDKVWFKNIKVRKI